MTPPFINLDEVEFDDVEDHGCYTSRRAMFSAAIGARKLGYNLTILPPGKAQCPFHAHRGEEEMFLILEGEGELRFGDRRYPIRAHDVIACPTGGPEVAHQIINTAKPQPRPCSKNFGIIRKGSSRQARHRLPCFAGRSDKGAPAKAGERMGRNARIGNGNGGNKTMTRQIIADPAAHGRLTAEKMRNPLNAQRQRIGGKDAHGGRKAHAPARQTHQAARIIGLIGVKEFE